MSRTESAGFDGKGASSEEGFEKGGRMTEKTAEVWIVLGT